MAYVGGTSNAPATASAQTLTYSPTAGNAVVIGVLANVQTTTLVSVIDSAAHTYVSGTDCTISAPQNSGAAGTRIWYVVIPNVASGLTSFAVTISASGVMCTAIAEFSGRSTVNASIIDQQASALDSGTSVSIPDGKATITTTNAADDLVEVWGCTVATTAPVGGTDQASGAGASYTIGPATQSRLNIMKVANLGATGLYQAGMSWTTTAQWAVAVIALAPPASGGAVVAPKSSMLLMGV